MGYQRDDVKQMIVQQHGGIQNLAASVGQAEGGSRESVHNAAIQFWQLALSLLDGGEVIFNRAFAEGEIARHQAELAKLNPEPAPYPRNNPV